MLTKITFEVFLPTTSTARVNDFILACDSIAKEHKGRAPFVTFQGPFNEQFERNLSNVRQSEGGEPVRNERAEAAAADFAEPEASGDGKPGRKPRSDAGQPRGPRQGKTGSAAEGPERGAQAGGAKGGAGGDGDGATAKGGQRGGGTGKGKDGGPGGGVGRTGDAHRGNEQAASVEAAEEDWDNENGGEGDDWDTPATDESEGEDQDAKWWCRTPGNTWPDKLMPEGEITRTVLSGLMSDHFRAAGGKQKAPTFEIIREISNVSTLSDVPEADYDALARALLKDTARYEHGVKKPVTTAPKA